MAKLTEKVFKERLLETWEDEYRLVGEYQGVSKSALFHHKQCGNNFRTNAGSLSRGDSNCPYCRKDHRLGAGYTHEEIDNKITTLSYGEYVLDGVYTTMKTPVRIVHNKCGYIFEVTPDEFIHNGRRCPRCSHKCGPSDEIFRWRVSEMVGDEYTFTGEYETSHKNIPVTHNLCGYRYEVTPVRFILRGHRCPKCAGNARLSNEDFIARVKEQVGEEYTFLEEYRGIDTKIKVRHEKCSHVYKVSPYKFLIGRRCPNENYSVGEDKVRRVLEKEGVEYEREKLIGGTLRADFFLPEYQSFIEYDGIQHFEPVEYWGGEDALKETMRRDAVKNHYFNFLGFNYLRIPYYEIDNIEEIVSEFIQSAKEKEERQWQ